MINRKEKKQLFFKIIITLVGSLTLLSLVRVLSDQSDFTNNSFPYISLLKELSFSFLSAVFVILILYLFINKDFYILKHKAVAYAFTDALTGLYNRRYLNNFLEKFTSLRKDDTNFAVVFIDIDNFKLVNDTLGHVTGDCILKILASKLKLLSRPKDILCRYGGEEFIIIFSDIPKEQALEKAEHIRSNIEGMLFDCEQQKITISVGLSIGTKENDINQSIEEADKALYMAKNAGRNCVKVFSSVV